MLNWGWTLALIIGAWLLARRIENWFDERRRQLYGLQFWSYDDEVADTLVNRYRLHFPSMMLKRYSEDSPTVLWQVRRSSDGTWQTRLTATSFEIEIRRLGPEPRGPFLGNAYLTLVKMIGGHWPIPASRRPTNGSFTHRMYL